MKHAEPTPEQHEQQLEARLQQNERNVRLGVGLFAGCLLVAIVLSVQVSTLGVSFGTVVHGSPVAWPGHEMALRVAAFDPLTSRLVEKPRAWVDIPEPGGRTTTVAGEGDDWVELQVPVPRELVSLGEGWLPLRVRLATALGDDEVEVPVPLRGPKTPPLEVHHHEAAWIPKAPKPAGPWELALYPENLEAVSGLQNRITGWLRKDGRPAAGVTVSSPLWTEALTTDSLGLFEFHHRPLMHPQGLAFFLGTPPEMTKVDVPLDFRPRQLRLVVSPGRWVPPGSEVSVRLETLPLRTPVRVDVWIGDVLLRGDSGVPTRGERHLTVSIPEDATGWLRIEAYRLVGAAEGNLVRYLGWVSREDVSLAVDEVLEELEGAPGEDPVVQAARGSDGDARRRFVELAMSRVTPQGQGGMPRLRNNLEARREQVHERVKELRGRLNGFFVAVLGLGLALAFALVIRHQLRMGRDVRTVLEEGVQKGEAVDPERIAALTRFGHTYDLALVLAALALCGYGIWLLLHHLSWQL